MPDSDYVCEEIIDHVVDLLGRRFRKSQIKAALAEINGGERLKGWVSEKIINLARKKIRETYNTDPVEFKGAAIEFYESILRGRYSLRYKLQARQQLDKLLGLENISTDDPSIYTEKVVEALQEMDESVLGKPDNSEEPKSEQESVTQETEEASVRSNQTDEEADKQRLEKELKGIVLPDKKRNLDIDPSVRS
jgi:hypothetical protein